MSEIEDKINKIAHENCLTQLNRANTRIVEFSDYNDAHQKYLKNLKKKHKEKYEKLQLIIYELMREMRHGDFSNGVMEQNIDQGETMNGEFMQDIKKRLEEL